MDFIAGANDRILNDVTSDLIQSTRTTYKKQKRKKNPKTSSICSCLPVSICLKIFKIASNEITRIVLYF